MGRSIENPGVWRQDKAKMPLAHSTKDKTVHSPTSEGSLCNIDFYAWAMEQAALIRRLAPSGLDVANLAEEIEDLGLSARQEVESRLEVLLIHLLKYKYQADQRKGGWEATIRVQRRSLLKILMRSPSLKRVPHEELDDVYENARLRTHIETGLPLSDIPNSCPFDVDQILDGSFFGV